MEWDMDKADGDPMEDFAITLAQEERREAASRSRQHCQEGEYMEGVGRGVLEGAYVEELRSGRRETEKEMELAAVRTRGRRRCTDWLSSRPAFMVSKAANAAVWEGRKNIRPPIYDGNLLYLDRFLEKLDDRQMNVTEDMEPAQME